MIFSTHTFFFRFDPARFSPDNVSSRDSFSFVPFGFAGKRKCPGYRFAYHEITVILALVLQKYQIKLAEERVIEPQYGWVTRPKDEIWVTVEKRV